MLWEILLYVKHNFPYRLKKIKLCKIHGDIGIRRRISEHAEEMIYTIEHKLVFCKSISCLFPDGKLRPINCNR